MKLEEKVTKGFIVYIHRIDYDVVNKRLVIRFLKNPEEQQRIARVLTFSKVQNFSDELDKEDFDKDCLDSLIGLQEYQQQTGVQYVVRTEQREMVFFTDIEPHLQEME